VRQDNVFSHRQSGKKFWLLEGPRHPEASTLLGLGSGDVATIEHHRSTFWPC
jgi:hypothetical protein